MAYTEITNYDSPNFNKGRQGRGIRGITIHWWGDPATNPSFEGVCNWLCNPRSQVSAHAVVTGTGRRVAWLVNCEDTAWHAGNFEANLTQIGLELDPRCRNEDYDVAAELIADLWRAYGKLPVVGHSHWSATRCPGNYNLSRLIHEAELKFSPPKPAPVPTPPAPAPPKVEAPPVEPPKTAPEAPQQPENKKPSVEPAPMPKEPEEAPKQNNNKKDEEKSMYDEKAIKELNAQAKLNNELLNDASNSDEVKQLVNGISKPVKLSVYIIGDALIGAGLILPSLAVAFNFGSLQQIQALSSACATAGAFILTMFGIYKSGKNK